MKWLVTYSWILFLFVAVKGYTQNLNFSGGQKASIFLCKDGHVYVSGANDFGQLGRGALPGINSPDIVSGIGGFGTLKKIKQVSARQDLTMMALSSTGDSVITWGNNSKGELGNNLYGNGGANNNKYPYRVVGVGGAGYLTGVKYIAMGVQTGYAVLNNGKVVAWGSGGFGALGNGTNGPDMTSPVYVLKGPADTLKNVVSISAGNEFAIAVLADGTVWGWGQNNIGQLGQNTIVTTNYAVQVKGRNGVGFLSNILSVSCSDSHVLALSSTDTTWGWGNNTSGQLGNNTNTNALTPVFTLNSTGSAALRNVRSISVGYGFSMALRMDSTISVWGDNTSGRFGNNTTTSSLIPTKVLDQFGLAPLKDIVQISNGQYYSFAQRKNGMIWGWGDNANGQLAMGNNSDRYLPDTVTEPCVWVTPPAFVKGTISGPALVCGTPNSGTVTLSGQTGSVVAWQTSVNNFVNYSVTASSSQTFGFTNISQKTAYRAVIKFNDLIAYSDSLSVQYSAASFGGALSSSATVCATANSGTLTMTGHVGTVVEWQSSLDSFATAGTPIVNTNAFYTYNNLATTTFYRVVVKNNGCPNAYSPIVKITVDAPTAAGTLSSSATVCATSNGATLTLAGKTGSVVRWESSTDGFATPVTIVNNTTSYTYSNVTATTQYRVVVKSGVCALQNSSVVTIAVDQASVAGLLSSPATVCSGSNAGTLTLGTHTGGVVQWEASPDNFVSTVIISNTTSSYAYSNLLVTQYYRVLVQNGVCGSVYSNPLIITVDSLTAGGTLSPSATVCASSNGATLTLSGKTGTVVRWESSTDGFATPITISNTTTSYTYSNLAVTTQFRALVKSGVCASQNSSIVTINVDPTSVPGTLSSPATVCANGNSGTLNLGSHVGDIIQWESSPDNFSSSVVITNTGSSYGYTNLTASQYYRVLVQSGVCTSAYSNVVKITVDSMTVGGTVSLPDTVCFGLNAGTMQLSGKTGNVLKWEYSSDNFNLFSNDITNTTVNQSFSNLTVTTYYRAVLQSGVCPILRSSVNIIKVDPVSSGGSLSPSSTVVCSGTNAGTLTLASQVGDVLEWQSSSDIGFSTHSTIANVTLTENYLNLASTTYYRVKIQNGVCASVYSPVATITATPVTVPGTLSPSTTTVCYGTNTGTLTLSTQTGSIVRWEFSHDNFVTDSTVIVNTTGSYTFSNLITNTQYRVRVKNGICPGRYSAIALVNVDLPSVAGPLGLPDTICSGGNVLLNIGVSVGAVVQWESSTDGFVAISNPIANTTNTFSYNNLTTTTSYRVQVKNGVCGLTYSNIVKITVNAPSAGGIVNSSTSECSGTNSGLLSVVSKIGDVLHWESSTDNFNSITVISNTGTGQPYTNLTTTTQFRAIVQNGVCPSQPSSRATITIYDVSSGGTIDFPDTVCFGFNTGTLSLHPTSFTGNIIQWESSLDNL